MEPTADVLFSKDVGTELYKAPEVRAGRQYGPKVDIFAVGIIVVELWSEFSTEMERIQTLIRARDSLLPDRMLENHPIAARLAAALLQKDPELRPGAAEVGSPLNRSHTRQ
jgi:serine/threonine protein kinase